MWNYRKHALIIGVPAATVYLSRTHCREGRVSWLQLVVLAVVQGITEFLPISSQAHLVLVPAVTGWPDQGLAVDVAVHVGTLGAVMVYFRRDICRMVAGIARRDDGGKLALQIIVATVPVVLAGAALFAFGAERLRGIAVIGWATLGFGVLLFAVDRASPALRRLEQMTLGPAALIGLAQVFALIPGASRSGVTMTAARALGFERRRSRPIFDAAVDPGYHRRRHAAGRRALRFGRCHADRTRGDRRGHGVRHGAGGNRLPDALARACEFRPVRRLSGRARRRPACLGVRLRHHVPLRRLT